MTTYEIIMIIMIILSLLSVVLTILGIVVKLLVDYINAKK